MHWNTLWSMVLSFLSCRDPRCARWSYDVPILPSRHGDEVKVLHGIHLKLVVHLGSHSWDAFLATQALPQVSLELDLTKELSECDKYAPSIHLDSDSQYDQAISQKILYADAVSIFDIVQNG